MPTGQPELRYGRIVWAALRDPRGFRKERPAIVLTPTEQITAEAPIVVMAITTSFAEPPPRHHVPLPWNADPRRVRTRLAQRSAAVVTWLDSLRAEDVIETRGDVPVAVMRDLQERLQALRQPGADVEPGGDPGRHQ